MDPVAYEGSGGQWFMHPDVKAFVEKDIFVAVTPRAATGAADGTSGGEIELARGDSTVLGAEEYAVAFSHFEVLRAPAGMPMSSRSQDAPEAATSRVPDDAQIAVGAVLRVTQLASGDTRTLMPIYMVMDDNQQQYVENRVAEWDLRFAFTQMSVGSGKATFAVDGVDVMPEDWVVVQAYAKPMISLVWIGIIVLTIGFMFSIARRVRDIIAAQ
jgi:cytochrome c-type biogenesis protein CcmF